MDNTIPIIDYYESRFSQEEKAVFPFEKFMEVINLNNLSKDGMLGSKYAEFDAILISEQGFHKKFNSTPKYTNHIFIDDRFYVPIGNLAANNAVIPALSVLGLVSDLSILMKFKKDSVDYVSRHFIDAVTNYIHQERTYTPPPYKTYIIIDNRNGLYKIGKSISPPHREGTLQSKVPELKLLYVIDANVESELHKKYHHLRIRGEYFELTENVLSNIIETYKAQKVTS